MESPLLFSIKIGTQLKYLNSNLDSKRLIVPRKEFQQPTNLSIIMYEHEAFIAVKINHFSTSSC